MNRNITGHKPDADVPTTTTTNQFQALLFLFELTTNLRDKKVKSSVGKLCSFCRVFWLSGTSDKCSDIRTLL